MECSVFIQAKKFYFNLIRPQNILPIVFWLLHMPLSKLCSVLLLENSGFLRAILPCTPLLFNVLPMLDSGPLISTIAQEVFSFLVSCSSLWPAGLLHTLILVWSLLANHSREGNNRTSDSDSVWFEQKEQVWKVHQATVWTKEPYFVSTGL